MSPLHYSLSPQVIGIEKALGEPGNLEMLF